MNIEDLKCPVMYEIACTKQPCGKCCLDCQVVICPDKCHLVRKEADHGR